MGWCQDAGGEITPPGRVRRYLAGYGGSVGSWGEVGGPQEEVENEPDGVVAIGEAVEWLLEEGVIG